MAYRSIICEMCLNKNNNCYCSPNSTCSSYISEDKSSDNAESQEIETKRND